MDRAIAWLVPLLIASALADCAPPPTTAPNALAQTAAPAASATPNDDRTFAELACENHVYRPVRGLRPGVPVDYVALVAQLNPGVNPLPGANVVLRRINDTEGRACATATDATACAAQLASLSDGNPLVFRYAAFPSYAGPRWSSYLTYTRGDTTGIVPDDPSVIKFLAPIDTPTEAALVWSSQSLFGYRPSGEMASWPCPKMRVVDGGYEFLEYTGGGCYGDRVRQVIRIARDGTRSQVSSTVLAPGSKRETCPIE
jgi:hypothetical protein